MTISEELIAGKNKIKLIFNTCHIITATIYLIILGYNPASFKNCILLVLMVERSVNIVKKNPIRVQLIFSELSIIPDKISSDLSRAEKNSIYSTTPKKEIDMGQYFSILTLKFICA